jgi:hypothetical protein
MCAHRWGHTRQKGTRETAPDGAAARRSCHSGAFPERAPGSQEFLTKSLCHLHALNLTPIEVDRPAGCVKRAGPARRRRAENGGMFFFCVAIVGSALVRTRTAGSAAQRCVVHGECQDGFFCGVSLVDSYEGWLYQASFCRPCSQCECNHDSSTAKCPADRFACLFAPHASQRFRVRTGLSSRATCTGVQARHFACSENLREPLLR